MLYPCVPASFKDIDKSDNVSVNIGMGILQGVTNPCLCSKINHSVKTVFGKEIFHPGPILKVDINMCKR